MAPASSQNDNWDGSSNQDVDYRDWIVRSDSSPTAVPDEYDADSESDPFPRRNNVAPQPTDAWGEFCSVDYYYSPSYGPNHSSPLHHNGLKSRSPVSTSSSSFSSRFVVRHFTDSEDEAQGQPAAETLVYRLTTVIDVTAEAAAEHVDKNKNEGQELTEAHLDHVRDSVFSVYESLMGCHRTVTTPEQVEEVRRIRENPPPVTWEHLMGPFGYEQYQQNYHQRSQTEQYHSPQVRASGDDGDFVQRVEKQGKVEMEKAKYLVGMKGFLRLNA
ncbi:MAG: hypothetical protein Q9184_000387 [Pyrenodesmia sp. 2 TL-2023]